MDDGSSVNGIGVLTDDESFSLYKKDALNVVNFAIVEKEHDLKEGTKFPPEMAHQVFGDSELIFGYRGIEVDVFFLHNSFKCFVRIETSGEIKGHKPDDVGALLADWLPEGFVKEKEEFLKLLKEEKHDRFFGERLQDEPPAKKRPVQYFVTVCDGVKSEEMVEFHQRFQTLIIWFIDAANLLDLSDERWMIFYLYSEKTDPETHEVFRTPIGFCTVYKFFSYPKSTRARISQFFILPPYQKAGLGTQLYKSVVEHLRQSPEIVDITVEGPTEIFQCLRDKVDCNTIYQQLKEPTYKLTKQQMFSNDSLKICTKQKQRCHDLLRLVLAERSGNSCVKSVEKSIKTRLENEIKREFSGPKRMKIDETILENMDNSKMEGEFLRYLEALHATAESLIDKLNR